MFTGIVEEIGKLISIKNDGSNYSLNITASFVMENIKIGDSIAVNGVCLTVRNTNNCSMTGDVMPETMRRSTLHSLKQNSPLNLERALRIDGRADGHIVTGHIDETGRIVNIWDEKNSKHFRIQVPSTRYVVEKGSIAIDGTSLTVVSVDDTAFEVALIPHTLRSTILSSKRIGDNINIEYDIIAKYVEKYTSKNKKSELGTRILIEKGF